MRDIVKIYSTGHAWLGKSAVDAGFHGDVPRQFNAVTQVLIKPGTPDEEIVRSLEITIQDIQLRMIQAKREEAQRKENQNNTPPAVIHIPAPEPEDMLVLEYVKIFKPTERVKIPAGGDPEAFLNDLDPIFDQIKKIYPDHKINSIDFMTIGIEGQKYYQPTRIILQRYKRKGSPTR